MSYNNRADNFSVTSSHDGSRVFRGNHDFRFTQGSSRGSRGRGGNSGRGNRRPNFRHFNSSSSRYTVRNDRNEDAEGDVSMSGDSRGRGNRSNRYNRGRGNRGRGRGARPTPNTYSSNKTNTDQSQAFYRVTVPFGNAIQEKEMYDLIAPHLDGDFHPTQYSTDERRAYFYIKGSAAAESLRSISRRITKPDGRKMVFVVSPTNQPPMGAQSQQGGTQNLSDDVIEKLKVRMSDRYEPSTQVLNLSNLFNDEVLSKEGIRLPLARVGVMNTVTKIITEHIPELRGLDFSDNRLSSLGFMANLVKGAPGVVSLNLAKNEIRFASELDKLKGWAGLTEIVLDGNKLCTSFSSQSAYVSAIRKSFPKVVRLDNTELPPPITFDLDDDVKLPDSKGSYFFNDSIKDLLVPFIKEYFTIYDSERRRDLMPAYHENAQVSLYYVHNPLLEKQPGFNSYFDNSRNLKKIGHYEQDKLSKRILSGNLHIIAFLEKLPQTIHDLNQFKVDVSVATPTLLSFVLHGVFRETGEGLKPLRTFSRSFVTVPSGSGMVIINDMLTISNAGYNQKKNAFKNDTPAPPVQPAPTLTPLSPPGTAPPPGLTAEQMLMVEKFTADSGMNAKFSLKCLQENGWEYQRAGQVFTELNSQGKIPPDAFVKSGL